MTARARKLPEPFGRECLYGGHEALGSDRPQVGVAQLGASSESPPVLERNAFPTSDVADDEIKSRMDPPHGTACRVVLYDMKHRRPRRSYRQRCLTQEERLIHMLFPFYFASSLSCRAYCGRRASERVGSHVTVVIG